jgi:hypothetical protein
MEEFIKEFWLIPPEAYLPDFKTIETQHPYKEVSEVPFEEMCVLRTEAYEKMFNECYKQFSEEFKQGYLQELLNNATREILEENSKHSHLDWSPAIYQKVILSHYENFRIRYNIFRDIAVFFSHLRKNDYQSANERELITPDGETFSLPIIDVRLVRNGTIGNIQQEVAEMFVGVDLDRIRACEICNRIFWAKREDSKTCSPKCFGVLRTRDYRKLTDEEKAARKARRQANKEYKKKLKELRKNKNGTL